MNDSYQSRRVAGVTGGDILFEDFDFSFKQQISHVDHLQKAVDKYGAAIREAKSCMQNVNECLAEFYEDFWPKHMEYKIALKDSTAIWGILIRHVQELAEPVRRFKQLGLDAEKYLKKNDMKLTDGRVSNRMKERPYGGDRNPEMMQNMLQTGSDDRREKLKNVNDEMVDDLNHLFQQRGGFVIDIFKAVYTSHNDFYSELSKISKAVLEMVIDLENVQLEMSVGQGRHRRVASTNKPRIGWAQTNAPAQPAQQPTPSNQVYQAGFVPPPPKLGVPVQRGGRPKQDVQDIARPISVGAPGREKNPTEFQRGNEMTGTSTNKGSFKQRGGRSKQEVQDIARPVSVGAPVTHGNETKGGFKQRVGRSKQEVQDIARPVSVGAPVTHGNETKGAFKHKGRGGRSKQEVQDIARPVTVGAHGTHGNETKGRSAFGGNMALGSSPPPQGGRGAGMRGANMGGVGRGRGTGRGGGGIMFDNTGRAII